MTIVDGKRICKVLGCKALGKHQSKKFSKRMNAWIIKRKPMCQKHLGMKRNGLEILEAKPRIQGLPFQTFILICPHCQQGSEIKKLKTV